MTVFTRKSSTDFPVVSERLWFTDVTTVNFLFWQSKSSTSVLYSWYNPHAEARLLSYLKRLNYRVLILKTLFWKILTKTMFEYNLWYAYIVYSNKHHKINLHYAFTMVEHIFYILAFFLKLLNAKYFTGQINQNNYLWRAIEWCIWMMSYSVNSSCMCVTINISNKIGISFQTI